MIGSPPGSTVIVVLKVGGPPWAGADSVTVTAWPAASEPDAGLMDACRTAAPRGDARWGVTALPGVMVARYLGASAEAARSYFVELWKCTRPALLGREICLPRIWST